jgi:hypothetical protein
VVFIQSLGGNLTPSPVRDPRAWQPLRVPAALEQFKSLGILFDLLLMRLGQIQRRLRAAGRNPSCHASAALPALLSRASV